MGAWERSLVGDKDHIVKTREGLLVQVIPDSFWIVIFGNVRSFRFGFNKHSDLNATSLIDTAISCEFLGNT